MLYIGIKPLSLREGNTTSIFSLIQTSATGLKALKTPGKL